MAEMITPGNAVRVSLSGDPADVPEPIVLERKDGVATADGKPIGHLLAQAGAERAVLSEAGGGEAHRVLMTTAAPTAGVTPQGATRSEVVVDGWRFEVEIEPAARAALRERARRGRAELGQSGPTKVHAIIPGVVVSVSVAPGDAVTAGQQLLVIEAMKMQNELKAPREGIVDQVAVGAGSTIDVGDLLIVIA